MLETFEDFQDFFAKRLIELRMGKDFSARDMSLSIGQSKSYIGEVERKKYMPSMEVFFYICDYLKITPKDFFDEEIKLPEIYNELSKNLKQLDDEDIIHISYIVKKMTVKK